MSLFKKILIAALCWSVGYFSLTLLVDPYGVSPLAWTLKRVNAIKPKRLDIDRLIKPFEVWARSPRTVFLGTSRIHQSIDPRELKGSDYWPAYNASIPASSLGLNIAHFRQYVELNPNLKYVIIELFLPNFLGQGQERINKDWSQFVSNSVGLFVSEDALWASILTLIHNVFIDKDTYQITEMGYFHYPPGHDARGTFAGFPAGIWSLHEGRADGMKLYEPAFESVQQLIDIAKENEIELTLILTPNHAYDDYYIESVGEWHTIRQWLERLRDMHERVFSYSQPNPWVYESVSHTMQFWNDPYHFNLAMGAAIQGHLKGVDSKAAPSNFAIKLREMDVQAHIESRGKAIKSWALENPEFVQRFNEEREKWKINFAAPAKNTFRSL